MQILGPYPRLIASEFGGLGSTCAPRDSDVRSSLRSIGLRKMLHENIYGAGGERGRHAKLKKCEQGDQKVLSKARVVF